MFFFYLNNTSNLTQMIDGVSYDLTQGANNDMFHCKSCLVEICNYFDKDTMKERCNMDNYVQWKKDLIKDLRKWDSAYQKH